MADPTDVTALIAQLEAERDELNVTISFLRRKAGMASSVESNGVGPAAVAGRDSAQGRDTAVIVGRVRADEFFRLSTSDAIIKYLEIMKQPQTPVAVVNGLKGGGVLTNAKNFYANVNTELKRMRGRGLVVNTPSGWGLAEWYPQRPKQQETARPKKRAKKKANANAAKPAKAARSAAPAASPPAQAADGKKRTAYNTFMSERRSAGRSMAEAAAEWNALKKKEQR